MRSRVAAFTPRPPRATSSTRPRARRTHRNIFSRRTIASARRAARRAARRRLTFAVRTKPGSLPRAHWLRVFRSDRLPVLVAVHRGIFLFLRRRCCGPECSIKEAAKRATTLTNRAGAWSRDEVLRASGSCFWLKIEGVPRRRHAFMPSGPTRGADNALNMHRRGGRLRFRRSEGCGGLLQPHHREGGCGSRCLGWA